MTSKVFPPPIFPVPTWHHTQSLQCHWLYPQDTSSLNNMKLFFTIRPFQLSDIDITISYQVNMCFAIVLSYWKPLSCQWFLKIKGIYKSHWHQPLTRTAIPPFVPSWRVDGNFSKSFHVSRCLIFWTAGTTTTSVSPSSPEWPQTLPNKGKRLPQELKVHVVS